MTGMETVNQTNNLLFETGDQTPVETVLWKIIHI